jgi:hypothetical protein
MMVVWDVTGINAAGERILAPHTQRASGAARTDTGSSCSTTESGHEPQQPPQQPKHGDHGFSRKPPQISEKRFLLSCVVSV